MSLTRDEIVERGRREWEEKSEHDRDWRGWLHIGEALDVGRREVENRIANRTRRGTTARFKGRAFNERFGLRVPLVVSLFRSRPSSECRFGL